MAVNIIRDPSLSGLYSNALGTGLQSLVDAKISGMQARHQKQQAQQGLGALGLNPQEAAGISQLPEDMQSKILLAYLQRGGGAQGMPQGAIAQEQGISELQQGQQNQMQQGMPTQQEQATGLAGKLAQPTLKEQRLQANEDRKFALKERQIAQADKVARFKETKKDREAVLLKYKNAKQTLHDLDRFEELEKEGKLDTPGYVEFLKRSGFDIPALMEPGSEEFNKIAANFIRGAKEVFGNRVTGYELEQFLKTIPNLSQSPEGRKRVIANMKYIARAEREYGKAMQEVMKENEGVPPYDLLGIVTERVDAKMDKLAAKLKKDLEKPVPAGQKKYITALQAGAGTAVSRLPRAAIGATSGAVLGSKLGLYGALGGGALGGLAGLFGVGLKDIL